MASYTIRVELRGTPSYQDYEKLHQAMGSYGWSRTITGVNPQGQTVVKDLPHALYYGQSNLSVSGVRDQIQQIVKAQVQPNFIVFVAETSNWALG